MVISLMIVNGDCLLVMKQARGQVDAHMQAPQLLPIQCNQHTHRLRPCRP
jgi:hypothetical protein